MNETADQGFQSRFFYVGIIFAVNFGIVGLMWRFRGVNWILIIFSLAWVLLVTAFAWEIITRAERLDRIVRSRTDALEETNRHLTSVLDQLRAFHRISYEMNQKLGLNEITTAATEKLCRMLPLVDSAWLWLDRAMLRVDRDGMPKGRERERPLDLASQAGPTLGAPAALKSLSPDNPLLQECFDGRRVTVRSNLPAKARTWGWEWLEKSKMQSFAGLRLQLGSTMLGVMGVFSREQISPEFVRQLHLSVNQLTVVLEKARLLKQMRRRAAELAAVNEELRELDAMKDWFVSAVSHELRTPLTNIRSYSEILENYNDLDPAERTEFAGIIREESERLSRMIDDLLDLAKIANGDVELKPEALNICSTVERCCRLFSQEAEESGVDIRVSLPDDTPRVLVDENAVVRVLNNLLGNALKFTPEGGEVEVTVEAGGPAPPGARFVTVLVSDTGCGIPLDDQARIFEKFTQVGEQLSNKPSGSGIGLAICREIVAKSDGDIWVQSTPGEGSTFGFTLPVAEPEPEAEQEEPEPERQSAVS
jgi:signal transduction histidine kinase